MKEYSACTTILVGKNASIDGSTMIARNDDTFRPITPQKFIIRPAAKGEKGRKIKSWLNKFTMDLPEDAQAVPAVPNVDYQHRGYYDESGINQENVAMSCTESTYGNERALAFDPLVKDGLDEDCMQSVVLPYIHSAKNGVEYLGKLIAKYGSPAGNSVLFSDQDEIWYMEIVTGHHWVAQRIPDDAYAIAANRVSIEQVDFSDPDNFMWSDGIQEFVTAHHLNTDHEGWNFRHIFGTYTEQDRHYNTNRVWYGQKYFNPEVEQDPTDGDLPFIRRAAKKITREDIEFVLGSHYQDTPYDPFGKGTEEEKHRFRPIGLNRTQNAHILQIRSDVDQDKAAIMWLCIGGPTFTPFVPFFANMNDTDPSYNNTSMDYNMKDAWWYYKSLATIVESHYPQFVQLDTDYLKDLNQYFRRRVEDVIAGADGKSGSELTAYLTKANQETVAYTRKQSEKLWGQMMIDSINMSKLTFNMDENL
ncbi:C69 family dipeptidase [Lactobacillus sp. ESL0731]|uniref:C69 family dipeptidase n=1 Tax=unclassified Lactobacillus TaxID=2620435 RepID=UPI0023F9E7B2|nr:MULTISPECIES: C69 family dipeptidase [unclassified Lactobacillus]WEV50460.1 C69 family dipeptidase [Lactobacillus sp. ESL0700]WEV61590.1 C69 family dipeptidase [Lactobacillus sp. ESL0731]